MPTLGISMNFKNLHRRGNQIDFVFDHDSVVSFDVLSVARTTLFSAGVYGHDVKPVIYFL